MEGALVIDAINAGGNLGLLFMGLALIRTNGRVARLEIQYELRQEAKSDIH